MFEFAVRRPVAVTIIMLALIGLGVYFGNMLNIEFFPKLDIPMVSVTTLYPGAGPEEVEEQVTKRLEDSLGSVANLKKISSTSQDNVSLVMLEFEYGTNMTETLADVREKIDEAKMRLPKDARPPVAIKADPASSPVMRLTLSGQIDLRTLRIFADDDLKKQIEKIPGVANVSVSGGYQREILVAVDAKKLRTFNLTPQGVLGTIQMENLNVPGGRITTDKLEFQVRTVGEFKTVEDILSIYVGKAGDRKLYMRDIAEVTDTHKEQRSISRIDGIPCVSLQIRRTSDANVVKVCDKITNSMPILEKILPQGSKLDIIYDESEYVKQSINAMKETAIEGAILAIIVILIFLGSLRSTLIVSLSIPTSIVATFIMMYFSNITINLITLSAFTLAIGRVVDDSIVVLENIFRFVEQGMNPFEAAIKGAKEVGLAVMASTFTTISVFFPLLIVSGIVGQIFTPLSKTFMTALLLSMLVAVLLIPMLAARVIKHVDLENGSEAKAGFFGRIFIAWNRVWKGIEEFYRKALALALHHRAIVLVIAFGLFLGSLFVFAKTPKEMAPKMDRGRTVISIEAPIGSSVQNTDKIVKEAEALIKKEVPEIKHLIADVGMSPSGQQSFAGGSGSEEPRKGGVSLYLVELKHRKRSIFEIQDTLRPILQKIPGATFRVQESMSLTGEAALQFIIKGDDLATLAELGDTLQKKVAAVPGAADIDLNWRTGSPEYRIVIDRVKAGELGVNLADIGMTVSTYVKGDQVEDISKFKEKGKEYDITVQLPESDRDTIEEIKDLPVKLDKETQVPLWTLADVTVAGAPSKITREDRSRCVIIQGNTAGRAPQYVIEDIKATLSKEKLPNGYTWEVGGEEKRRAEAFGHLFGSLFLAIFLVYGILAIQFESFIHPFTIMMAIPLELVGVAATLVLSGEPVSMTVLLGLIMLTGIVVSNSILLVNYIIVLREEGVPRAEAILRAGPTRLRPIMMTAMATMIAMIPLALGLREGGEFFAPLAKIVIGGLLTSTAFTLLVVPCFYSFVDDIGMRLGLAKRD
ncbi:MAG: efflux RND transporter permease subunit [Candidatus Eremiobacteraeota bacterium]|nr:efflux RND transporter permease subunit [Candidatus Eremiobacteraeota bacterium]